MATSFELPCIRCGRSVVTDAASPPPTCDRCRATVDQWEVRVGPSRERFDSATLRARLLSGAVAGTDMVVEGARSTPIAAHPAFRTWFLPGHPDALPVVAQVAAAVPTPGRGRRVAFGGLAVVAALGIGAVVVLNGQGGSNGLSAPSAGAAVAPAVEVPPVSPVAEVPPAGVEPVKAAAASTDPFDRLLERVGPVDEPRASLLAAAWRARNTGTADGLAAAVTAAERAVARAPEDPEALGTLAAFYAEAGVEPKLRGLLVERATTLAPSAPATLRAAALVALAGGDLLASRRAVDNCLAAAPTDLGCREALATWLVFDRSPAKQSDAQNQVYAVDQLALAWPDNHTLAAKSALIAARAELPGAEQRLDVALAAAPVDVALREAAAYLAYRNGTWVRASKLLEGLDTPSDTLLVEAAGAAIGRGDAAEARVLLGRQHGAKTTRDARLYEVQALVLLIPSGGATPAEAEAAVARLTKLDATSPAAVQARLVVARLAGDRAAGARASEELDTKAGSPLDVSRAWLARAAFDFALDHPRDAVLGAESALRADGSDPDPYLWLAALNVATQNPAAALTSLRGAIASVDGRHLRRRPYGGALPVPADTSRLGAAFDTLGATDPAHADDVAVAKAVVAWLQGNADAALAAVDPVAARGNDADALALQARLLLAKGQHQQALAAVDKALTLRPKEVAWQLVRAEALLASGRTSEAEAALTAARSGNTPGSSLNLIAGALAAKKGDAAAALVARRAAVKADDTDLVARRALRGVTEQ